jgi:hypothetical protein
VIVKENIKAVLSNNKILVSAAFAAIIQTLKTDPQMVKLIYNISIANNGEQCKDNNNNIANYLEANKDSLLNLAEKNYENLVEVLTNNVMNTAANSSYNPTLSLHSRLHSQVHLIKVIYTEQRSLKIFIIVKAILLIELIRTVPKVDH